MAAQKSYLKEIKLAFIAAIAVGFLTNILWGLLVFVVIGIYVSRNEPAPKFDDDYDINEESYRNHHIYYQFDD